MLGVIPDQVLVVFNLAVLDSHQSSVEIFALKLRDWLFVHRHSYSIFLRVVERLLPLIRFVSWVFLGETLEIFLIDFEGEVITHAFLLGGCLGHFSLVPEHSLLELIKVNKTIESVHGGHIHLLVLLQVGLKILVESLDLTLAETLLQLGLNHGLENQDVCLVDLGVLVLVLLSFGEGLCVLLQELGLAADEVAVGQQKLDCVKDF